MQHHAEPGVRLTVLGLGPIGTERVLGLPYSMSESRDANCKAKGLQVSVSLPMQFPFFVNPVF